MSAEKLKKSVLNKLGKRKKHSHKGDYGRVFLLAGSKGYTGAASLAATGALRSGAGLITLGVPQEVYVIVARRQAEVMVRPFPSTRTGSFAFKGLKSVLEFAATQDVLAIGPGLSRVTETQRFARTVLSKSALPAVVDADGLNALQDNLKVLTGRKAATVLTPHPGEFKRLFGGKLSDQTAIRKKRAHAAARAAGCTVVLKGQRTVVAGSEGEIFVNTTGNPGMASGGTGDVLTGMIAALMGQGFGGFDAACLAVCVHGLAGDLAARKMGQISLAAGDLLDFLPKAFCRIAPHSR